jgi:hypothetical protein
MDLNDPKNAAILDYLMGQSARQPEQDAIERKKAVVAQLRKGGEQMPGGSTTPGMAAGSGIYGQPQIYQAPHAMEFVGQLAKQGAGAYMDQQATEMQDALGQGMRDDLYAARNKVAGGSPMGQPNVGPQPGPEDMPQSMPPSAGPTPQPMPGGTPPFVPQQPQKPGIPPWLQPGAAPGGY